MAKTKKFKTIMGYLRSHGNPDADGERKAINHLLPQKGIDDPILPEETPREGLERLLQVHTEPRAVATLQDCLKWLGRRKVEMFIGEEVFVSGSSSYEPGGMIVSGKSYTPKETKEIEAIQRDHKVPMMEAIRIWSEASAPVRMRSTS